MGLSIGVRLRGADARAPAPLWSVLVMIELSEFPAPLGGGVERSEGGGSLREKGTECVARSSPRRIASAMRHAPPAYAKASARRVWTPRHVGALAETAAKRRGSI